MNRNQKSEMNELATTQKKQTGSFFSYIVLGLLGVWLFPHLFRNPAGREIEI